MCRMMIHGKLDIVPAITRNSIARGHHRPEVQDFPVHLVTEMPPAVLEPFTLQITRRYGDLIGAGRNRNREVDVVGVVTDIVAVPGPGITRRWRIVERLKAECQPSAFILQERILAETDRGYDFVVFQESPVVPDPRRVKAVANTGIGDHCRE